MTVFINFSFRWRAGMATVAVTNRTIFTLSPPRSPSLRRELALQLLPSHCFAFGRWLAILGGFTPWLLLLRLSSWFHGSQDIPKYSRGRRVGRGSQNSDCHLQEHRLLAGAWGLLSGLWLLWLFLNPLLHASPRWTVSRENTNKSGKSSQHAHCLQPRWLSYTS